MEIYSLIVDLKLSAGCQGLSDADREILQKIRLALESSVHVLQVSPHLLHSCLRNSPRIVQENVVIPPTDVVASTWMEWECLPYAPCKLPCDVSCFALSPDKKLLAGGNGTSIFLFDAYSIVKIFGPVKVIEEDRVINHLEFSPDGKFVFFGRFDKWFSVEKRCVEEFPQFSENNTHYKWASFIWNGRGVLLQRDDLERSKHSYACRACIFLWWAALEYHGTERMKSSGIALCKYSRAFERKVLMQYADILEEERIIDAELCSELKHSFPGLPCHECRYLGFLYNSLSIARQRVIDTYSEIFEYQVWDVQSGRPVLEQAFSSDAVLNSFTFLCHITCAFGINMALVSLIEKEGLSFFNLAFINFVSALTVLSDNCYESFLRDSFVVKNLPIEFCNHLAMKSRLSLDGQWIAVGQSYSSTVSLFKKNNLEHYDFGKPDHIIMNAKQFVFTDDSCFFLCVTENKSFHALSLQTGTILSSASGLIPLYCTPEEHVGYFFHARGEEKIIFAREFPRNFLSLFSIPSDHKPVSVTFTSADSISTLFSDCTVASWKTSGIDGSFSFCGLRGLRSDFFFRNVPANKDSYQAFSQNSVSFLYCITSSNNQPRFYVWDVQKEVISATFDSPLGPQIVHCCCFSADRTKLILCCAFQISIWEYDEHPCRLLANLEPFGPFNEFDKFSHCTVSSNNELLACCIVDRILLHPLNATARDQKILQLPRAHLGRIEFCQFLKGTRYLISYGVDGTVFLWDLCEWKAIAYARVAQGRESIASLAVSPKEDEVICFTSFGRLTKIKLCGLVHEMPSKFPTSDLMKREKMAAENGQRLGEQRQRSSTFDSATTPVDDVEAMDVTELLEDMNFMADENLESDDDIYELSESDE